MVIKIDEGEQIRYFDNCWNIKMEYVEGFNKPFNENVICDVLGYSEDITIIEQNTTTENANLIGVITFISQDKRFRYVFHSALVYLLNDNGKTIEKIRF